MNKAFKKGSPFCSLSRPYLQNEDPTDFASADNEQSIYAPVKENPDPPYVGGDWFSIPCKK